MPKLRKNFSQFDVKTTVLTSDYIVGYNSEATAEYRATMGTVIDMVGNQLLLTSIYRVASANFVQTTTLSSVSSILLPTSVFRNLSGSFATNTVLKSVSSLLTPLTLTNTLTSQLVLDTDLNTYKTNVAASTATLLPTTTYESASGNWENTYTNVQINSANWDFGYEIATYVQANSALWEESLDLTAVTTTVASNSGNWNKAYNIGTVYESTSSSFATNTALNSVSSQLILSTDFNSYKTNVAASTATLLPITSFNSVSSSFVTQTKFLELSSRFDEIYSLFLQISALLPLPTPTPTSSPTPTPTPTENATTGFDNTTYYTSWTNGSDGGTGFKPWSLTNTGNGGFFLGSSNLNGMGNINTGGTAFAMYGNTTGLDTAQARRALNFSLTSGLALSAQMAVAYRNGFKGITIYKDSAFTQEVWYFNIQNDQYNANGTILDWAYGDNRIFTIIAKQLTNDTFRIDMFSESNSYSSSVINGQVAALRFYIGNTEQSAAEPRNNLYFNNLTIGAFTPDPTPTPVPPTPTPTEVPPTPTEVPPTPTLVPPTPTEVPPTPTEVPPTPTLVPPTPTEVPPTPTLVPPTPTEVPPTPTPTEVPPTPTPTEVPPTPTEVPPTPTPTEVPPTPTEVPPTPTPTEVPPTPTEVPPTPTPTVYTAEDVASNTAYDDNFVNGDNGGTGFNAWSTIINGTAGGYVASSTAQGFGNINTNNESWALYANNQLDPFASYTRDLVTGLTTGLALSASIATAWRTGERGVNLWGGPNKSNFLVNFKAFAGSPDQYQFDGTNLTGAPGTWSQSAIWDIVAKQTTSNNVEITLTRRDQSLGGSEASANPQVVNKTGSLRGIEFYLQNAPNNGAGGTNDLNNMFFNSLKVYQY